MSETEGTRKSERMRDGSAPRWLPGVWLCRECGHQIEDWEAYCPWCGRKLVGIPGVKKEDE